MQKRDELELVLRTLTAHADLFSEVPAAVCTQVELSWKAANSGRNDSAGYGEGGARLKPQVVPAGPDNPHRAAITSVAFSRNSLLAASCDAGGQVVVWDVPQRRWRTRYVVINGRAEKVCFAATPDVYLATACEDGSIDVTDATIGRRIATLSGHKFEVLSLASAGHLLASGGTDQIVRLWDTESLQLKGKIANREKRPVTALSLDTCGTTLLIGMTYGPVECWNISDPGSPLLLWSITLPNLDEVRMWPGDLLEVGFLADTGLAFTLDSHARITILRSSTGTTLKEIRAPLDTSRWVSASEDGTCLICSSDDGSIESLSPQGRTVWKAEWGRGRAGAFAADGSGEVVMTGNSSGHLCITAPRDEERLWRRSNVDPFSCADINPTNMLAVGGSECGEVRVLELGTNRGESVHAVRMDRVMSIDINHRSGMIAAVGEYGQVVVASCSRCEIQLLRKVGTNGRMICFDSDGSRLAIGYLKDFEVIDVASQNRLILGKLGYSEQIVSGCFSSDGQSLFLGDTFGICRVVHLATEEVVPLDAGLREGRHWSGFIDESTKGWCKVIMELEPGKRLLTGAGRRLIVWDLIQGTVIRTLDGHRSDICVAAISEDGRWLATGGEDFRVLLRRLDTFEVSGAVALHSTPRALGFDSEGQRLLVLDELRGFYEFFVPSLRM